MFVKKSKISAQYLNFVGSLIIKMLPFHILATEETPEELK